MSNGTVSICVDLNGALLDDPRVNVIEADAVDMIFKGESHSYDALILDVDNGPTGGESEQ